MRMKNILQQYDYNVKIIKMRASAGILDMRSNSLTAGKVFGRVLFSFYNSQLYATAAEFHMNPL